MASSRLFDPYRTIGLVCDDTPVNVHSLGRERFATSSIGKGFLVYNLDKLHVKMISQQLPSSICALAALGENTFCALNDGQVMEFKRGKLRRTLLEKGHDWGEFVALLVFGKSLVMTGSAGTVVVVDIASGKVTRTIDISFTPTCVMHPDTYLNKIIVGGSDGAMALINIRSGSVVHQWENLGADVKCMTQSTVVDVIGIGLADGRVIVHNVRLDATLMSFNHKGGAVTCVSFRTDTGGPSGAPPFAAMVSGNTQGEIAVWDLDERRLASVIREAHDATLTSAYFLPGEPLLVTSGADNALKMYIFDQDDGQGRLFKQRQGHRLPPKRIRYYGGDTLSTLATGSDAAACHILSAGRDRAFRIFHTARDQLNRELSQGPLAKRASTLNVKVDQLKLPPMIDFAATEARELDWCNIVSAHAGEGAAFTWSLENRALGTNVLRPDGDTSALALGKLKSDKLTAKTSTFPAALCVAISSCGNFAVVGAADGTIFKYNMQSGLPRGSFPKPLSKVKLSKAQRKERDAKRRKLDLASVQLIDHIDQVDPTDPLVAVRMHPDRHDGPVNGVAVDALNSTLISAGYDGTIRFWDFNSRALERVLEIGSPVSRIVTNRDAGLLAAACDDLRIVVVDISARRVIRTFRGHQGAITDMAISTDARWLATSSSDTSLRVWDLPTARCVEWLEFPSPITGLTFSPTGEFLATSFADSVGITLWANKAFFGTVKADSIATSPVRMKSPSASAPMDQGEDSEDEEDLENTDSGSVPGDEKVEEAEFNGQVCFAGDERSKWYTLAHLELIKLRNRPEEQPDKPEKAPFFLPTSQSVNPVMVHPSKSPATKASSDDNDASMTEDNQDTVFEQAGDWSDDDSQAGDAITSEPMSRILMGSGLARQRTRFFQLLEEAHATYAASKSSDAYDKVVEHLHTLTPSAVDFELRSMTLGTAEDDDGAHLLTIVLEWIHFELESRTNFELVQAILSRTLALHDEMIVARPKLQALVRKLMAAQESAWKGLRGLIQHSLCLLSFFSHQQ